MRIHRERVPTIAKKIASALIKSELVEVLTENRDEVVLDVESVLKEYRRVDYEITEKARDLVAQRGLDYSHTFKLKSRLAKERRFALGDDAIQWLTDQMVEILLQSKFVEEVFGEDHELRAVIAPVIKGELNVESDLDREVRKRIRNMEEGTSDFEIEYQKTMERLRENKSRG